MLLFFILFVFIFSIQLCSPFPAFPLSLMTNSPLFCLFSGSLSQFCFFLIILLLLFLFIFLESCPSTSACFPLTSSSSICPIIFCDAHCLWKWVSGCVCVCYDTCHSSGGSLVLLWWHSRITQTECQHQSVSFMSVLMSLWWLTDRSDLTPNGDSSTLAQDTDTGKKKRNLQRSFLA